MSVSSFFALHGDGSSTRDRASVLAVMPAYNVAPYVGEAIDSIIAQTLRPSRLIVVDDASDDGTPSVARGHAAGQHWITVVDHSKNVGLAGTRNDGLEVGFELCANDGSPPRYVTFLDGDDRLKPTFLATLIGVLEPRPSSTIGAFCQAEFIDERSRIIGLESDLVRQVTNIHTDERYSRIELDDLLVYSAPDSVTMLFSRRLFFRSR